MIVSRHRRVSWLAFCVASALTFVANAECLSLVTPVGDWYHEGSDIPPNTIRLLNDGRVDFGDYYTKYHSGFWNFDKQTCELAIVSDSFTPNTLEIMESHIDDGNRWMGDPIRVDKPRKKIVYLLSTPEPRFNFGGFIYYKLPDSGDGLPPNQPLHPTPSATEPPRRG